MRIGVEVLGGLFAAAVLVVGVSAWRLSEGPVQTDFLTPQLQAAINDVGGNSIDLGRTFLVWEEGSRGLVMHAADVVVRDPEGKLVASLTEVAFKLSSSALLRGTFALKQIEIIAPRIRLLRAKDGSISFGDDAASPDMLSGDSAGAAMGTGEDVVVGRMVQELLSDRTQGNALSFLDEMRIRDGQLFVRDELLGFSWAAPSADISLRRDVAGLAGDISLSFTGRRDPATLDAAFLFDKNDRVVDFAAGFSDISLASLASAFPVLAPVGGLTSRISGSISTSLTMDGELGHTGFDLQGFAGSLKIPGVDMEPLPVREVTMRGRFVGTESRFDLDEARISLGSDEAPGPIFSVAGVFDHDPNGNGWAINTNATLEDVPLSELSTYWPPSVAVDARTWIVENITDGVVDKATSALTVAVPYGDFAAAEVTSVTAAFEYHGVEAHYLQSLPPVQGIAGTAVYEGDTLTFLAKSGHIYDLVLGDSTLSIAGIRAASGKKDVYEQLSINATAVGPIKEALQILELPNLDLLSKIDLTSKGSRGIATAELAFQFPLSKRLSFDHVSLQVNATVEDAALENVVFGQHMTDGRLSVDLDKSGMKVSGPLSLGGVPLTMQWRQSFADAPEVRSLVEADIPRVVDEERALFGLDVGDVIQGPMKSKVSMVARDNGLTTLQVTTDLKEATISLPEIHWQKEAGTEGTLRATIELDDEGPLAYRDVVLQAGDLVVRGKATPGPDREGLGSVELERLSFGRSNLVDVSVQLDEDGVDVTIGRGTLDAVPFVSNEDEVATKENPKPRPRDKTAPRTFEPFAIKAADLDTLYFAEERRLDRVNLELRRVPTGWETIRLSGSIPEQYWSPRDAPTKTEASAASTEDAPPQPVTAELSRRYIQLSFAPDASGKGQRLLAQSDDLGALMRATNIADTVVGGRIQITGHSDGPSPTYPITAKVAARDFVMVKAPALAKLLTVASFTGILNLLGGEGIAFQGMDGEFLLDDGLATTELMRVYGASLGITSKGQIDFDESAIDLTGVVVPAYSINNFLSKIPLLGPLLTGGEGEGVIAMVYSVEGAVDNPSVSVNPLSALTPGFLRNIFSSGGGDTPPTAFPDRIDK